MCLIGGKHLADSPIGDAKLAGNGALALSSSMSFVDFALDAIADTRPSQLYALGPRPVEAGGDTLADHFPLELGEDAHHLKQGLPARRGGVNALLVKIEIDALGVNVAEEGHEVLQAPAEPINGPGSDDIELAPGGVLAKVVKSWPLVPSLGATYAVIDVLCW